MKTFMKGMPEHGIPVSDPLRINEIDVSVSGLKFIIKNAVAARLTECTNIVVE